MKHFRPRSLLTLPLFAALLAAPITAQTVPSNKPAPGQPAPFHGQILDIKDNPILAGLPTKRITIDVDAKPAQQAAAAVSIDGLAMAIKTGPYRDLDDQLVTLHLHDAPYMEALMEVRQQLRASINDSKSTQITLIYRPDQEIPPWCVAGPFAVLYGGISSEVNFHYDARTHQPKPGGPTQRATLQLNLLAEPGIDVIQWGLDVQCPDLQDDKHQPIGLEKSATPTGSMYSFPLTLPDSPGWRILLLKGTIDVRLGATVRVDLANVTEKQTPPPLEGMTLEVSPLTPRNGSTTFYTMDVHYSRGTMPQEKWTNLVPILSSAKMKINGSGRGSISSRSAPEGRRETPAAAGDDLHIQYAVTIGQGAGPAGAATLDVPMGMTDVRVPFEFKDLILP